MPDASAVLSIALLASTEVRIQEHLEAIIQQGEVAGMRSFLRQELPALLHRAGLDERSNAGQCLALFADE